MIHRKKCCFLNHDGVFYCFNAMKRRVLIYTVKHLDLVDVLDSVNLEITKIVANPQTATVGVLYENFISLYAPSYLDDMSLKWKKKITHRFNVSIRDVSFSAGGEYILAAGQKHLAIYKIKYNYTSAHYFEIEKLEEFYKIEVEEDIKRCEVSPDSKYFATLGDNSTMAFIWDFASLIKPTVEHELGEDDDKQIVNYALVHSSDIVSFNFRENFSERIINKFQPNSFITLDTEGYIRIWQENLLKEGMHFYTIATIYIESDPKATLICYEWINIKARIQPDASYVLAKDSVAPKPVFPYGVYENENLSVDWLLISKPGNSIELYKITGLRNVSNNANAVKEFRFTRDEIKSFKTLSFSWTSRDDVLGIVGQDHDNNLIKIQLRIMKEAVVQFIRTEGELNNGSYIKSSFNRHEGSLLTLTDTMALYHYHPSKRNMPDYYHKLSYGDSKERSEVLSYVFCMLTIIVSDMFSFENFCFLFANSLEKLYVINLNQKTTDNNVYYIEPYKHSPAIFAAFRTLQSTDNSLRLLDSKIVNDQIECTLSLLRLNNLKIIKMKFFRKEFLLHSFQTNKKVIEIPNNLLTFTVLTEYNFEDSFLNYKTYIYKAVTQPELTFLAINEKFFYKFQTSGDKVTQSFKLKCPSRLIKYFGGSSTPPYYIYLLDSINNITFYSPEGVLVSRFAIKDLLRNLDETMIDIYNLKVSITPYDKRVFLVTVEKYLFVVYLEFDKATNIFLAKVLKRMNSNEIYLARVPKSAKDVKLSHKLYTDKSKNIIVVGGRKVKVLTNGCFDYLQFAEHQGTEENTDQFLAHNLQIKLLRSKINPPHHHPDFLTEILVLGKDNLAEYILEKLVRTLRKGESISSKFNISLDKIFEIENLGRSIPDLDEAITENDMKPQLLAKLTRRVSLIETKLPVTDEDFKWLAKEIYDKDCTNLQPYESLILSVLVETMVSNKANKRSLDDFAAVFIYYLKIFKIGQSHVGNKRQRQRCLMTKDIIWALHSQQKDTLIQECIDQGSEENLTWEQLRKFGIVIWYDNMDKIKEYLEKIARNEYRKTRDPYSAALWYIMLNKKNVLVMLCKKEEKFKSVAEFLGRNFNEDANKIAANKNAYKLLQQKKYELSATFFLLGGYIAEAINVLTDSLQDIQLAMLACKLLETNKDKPEFKKLIETHFINSGRMTDDIFLSSMGYYFLDQHVNSVNCLYEFHQEPEQEYREDPDYTKRLCDTWPQKYEPILSSFHPSAMILANKLRNSIKVKRELQASEYETAQVRQSDDIFASYYDDEPEEEEKEVDTKPKVELKEDVSIHVMKSMEYYSILNIPLLGLVCYIENKDKIEFNQVTKDLLKELYEKHLDLTIDDSIEYEDWIHYFEKLNKRVHELCVYFPTNVEQLRKYCEDKIRSLRSLKLSTAYMLSLEKYPEALENIYNVALELQNVLFNMSHRINFIQKEKHLIQNIVYVMSEISTSLGLFETHTKFTSVQGQQVKHMSIAPSKVARNGEPEKSNPLIASFNQKAIIIQFLLYAGIFVLVNSLYAPATVLKIIDIACMNMKTIASTQKPLSWASQKSDLGFFYNEIIKASDNLIIKAHFAHNPRSLEILKQVFKLFILENPPDIEVGNLSRLLGESIVTYLFAYTFLKQVGKHLDTLKTGSRLDTAQLSIARVYEAINIFKKCNKKTVLIFLSKFRLNDQFQILEEVKDFLQKTDAEAVSGMIPFKDLISDHSMLQRVDRNDIKKLIVKIHTRIASALLLRPTSNVDVNLEAEKVKILKTGFEVCKLRSEAIKAFCFNNYRDMKHELMVLSSRGIRKVSLLTNILYKARLNEGLSVPEEEALTLIDKDNYIHDMTDDHLREIELDTKDRPLSIKLAYNLLLDEKLKDQSRRRSSSIHMRKYEFHDYENIDGYIPPDATKLSGAKTVYDIHETNVIRSHPKLPIFCTGGRGIINIWSFLNLRVVNTLTSPQKELINVIKFNNFGDKLGAIDQAGVLNLWKFNLRTPITKPIYTINHQSKNYLSDFCFLNDSSVFAHCSTNPRNQFSIVDILLPPRNNAILTESIGGSQIIYSPTQHMLLLANSRRGIVSCYDIRKGMTMKNIEVSKEDVKSISLSCSNNVLIAGTTSSQIKLYSLSNFELINEVNMRTNVEKKPAHITDLEVLDECIFASNSDGILIVFILL